MNVDHLAAEQLKDFDRQRPGNSFAKPEVLLSVEQAYELQFQVASLREQRGEQVAGYKVGCISRTMQNQLGLDRPVFGHVWQSELHASGGTLQATRFDGLAIEGEFAVRLADDVPSAQWLRRNAEVLVQCHDLIFG